MLLLQIGLLAAREKIIVKENLNFKGDGQLLN